MRAPHLHSTWHYGLHDPEVAEFCADAREDTIAVSDSIDTQIDIAAMSDEGLIEALIVSMISTQDHDPHGRAHAEDRMHALRDEAQRSRLTLFEAP